MSNRRKTPLDRRMAKFFPSQIAACKKKKRHSDEPTARAFAAAYAHHYELSALYVYPCKVCGGWHVTRKQTGVPAMPNVPYFSRRHGDEA